MYTQEYLEAVEKAICDLQSGKRVTSISYGDTHVQYAPINLEDLLRLRSQIKASLAEVTFRKRFENTLLLNLLLCCAVFLPQCIPLFLIDQFQANGITHQIKELNESSSSNCKLKAEAERFGEKNRVITQVRLNFPCNKKTKQAISNKEV
ncbi:MAG: hypothetical protein IJA14_04030 [Alphaproteobacteria bacterium]|nr:hypothetical protein [Alphaproteobacteria bacterium]